MTYKRFTKETTSWIVKVAGTKMTQNSRFPFILEISEDEVKNRWEFRFADGISLLPPLKASDVRKEVRIRTYWIKIDSIPRRHHESWQCIQLLKIFNDLRRLLYTKGELSTFKIFSSTVFQSLILQKNRQITAAKYGLSKLSFKQISRPQISEKQPLFWNKFFSSFACFVTSWFSCNSKDRQSYFKFKA